MSAFFSGSETSMMAINRYRLKHLVKEKNKSAKRVSKLLEKTDRLLGVILIGNNFTHTLSTALATVVAIRIWSDNAVLAVTVFMTIIMIIFAEVMPKTIAALKPESIAFPSSYLLKPLSKILSPLITLVSFVSNNVTKLIGIDLDNANKDELKPSPHKIQGIGPGFVPANLDLNLVDRVECVSGEEAIEMGRRLAKEEGIFAGISCGAAASIASKISFDTKFEGKTIVVVLPDAGERYLSSSLFEN